MSAPSTLPSCNILGQQKSNFSCFATKTWGNFCCVLRKRRIGADVAAASAAQLPAKLNVCLPLRLSNCPSVRLSACPPVFPAVKCHSRSNAFTFNFHKGKQARSLSGSFKCIKHVFSAFFRQKKTATKILLNLWDTPRGAATERLPPRLPPLPVSFPL